MMETQKEEKNTPIIRIPRRKKHSVVDFMMMKKQEVIDTFMTLSDAQYVGTGDESFMFVPGTRQDRVLLVAHFDTVWKNGEEDIEILFSEGKYYSGKKGVGIGADDRAGVTMLWKLRNLGHSLLLPCAEERGCIGSKFLMRQSKWKEEVNKHQFAIEMDRRHNKDLVFYSVGSDKFTTWCESKFHGYKKTGGSFTDIGHLCEKMCGLNISVGYYNEHSDREILVEREWSSTLSHLHRVLSEKEIPRFEQDPKPVYNYSRSYSGHNTCSSREANYTYINRGRSASTLGDDYDSSESYWKKLDKKPLNRNRIIDSNIIKHMKDLVICLHCNLTQDVTEIKFNKNKCIGCQEEI